MKPYYSPLIERDRSDFVEDVTLIHRSDAVALYQITVNGKWPLFVTQSDPEAGQIGIIVYEEQYSQHGIWRGRVTLFERFDPSFVAVSRSKRSVEVALLLESK